MRNFRSDRSEPFDCIHKGAAGGQQWSRAEELVALGRISGLADEAASDIRTQIEAHRALGWNTIELRSVDDVPLAELSDRHFAETLNALQVAEFSIVALASSIGNWSGTIEMPFERDIGELARLLDFATKAKTRYIRIMSYPRGNSDESSWRKEVLRRTIELSARAADRGLVLLHENCHGWAGTDPGRALDLIHATQGRGLSLLFDTGNPVAHGYDGLAYLEQILPYVSHVHVKDARVGENGEGVTFTYPGAGSADVELAIRKMLDSGYDGAFSIEPHVEVRAHENGRPGANAFDSYVAYGRRLMELMNRRFAGIRRN
jgi:L-ribulose-5-phosphate 3-epimerase